MLSEPVVGVLVLQHSELRVLAHFLEDLLGTHGLDNTRLLGHFINGVCSLVEGVVGAIDGNGGRSRSYGEG